MRLVRLSPGWSAELELAAVCRARSLAVGGSLNSSSYTRITSNSHLHDVALLIDQFAQAYCIDQHRRSPDKLSPILLNSVNPRHSLSSTWIFNKGMHTSPHLSPPLWQFSIPSPVPHRPAGNFLTFALPELHPALTAFPLRSGNVSDAALDQDVEVLQDEGTRARERGVGTTGTRCTLPEDRRPSPGLTRRGVSLIRRFAVQLHPHETFTGVFEAAVPMSRPISPSRLPRATSFAAALTPPPPTSQRQANDDPTQP